MKHSPRYLVVLLILPIVIGVLVWTAVHPRPWTVKEARQQADELLAAYCGRNGCNPSQFIALKREVGKDNTGDTIWTFRYKFKGKPSYEFIAVYGLGGGGMDTYLDPYRLRK